MKRMIAGLLLMLGLGAGTVFASDGYWRDRRDIRRDLYRGNYAGARYERRDLRHEYRDLNRDRRDLYWDRR